MGKIAIAVIDRKHAVFFLKLLHIFYAQACQWLCIQQFYVSHLDSFCFVVTIMHSLTQWCG